MQKTLDEIRALNIVDIIGKYITLKKKGINYQACCPFHNEKTPSFSVSTVKNMYKCFGCGVGGDGINFVMEHDKVDFITAVKKICDNFNITFENKLTEKEIKVIQKQKKEADNIYSINSHASEIFNKNLLKEDNALSLEYILSRTNLEMIEKFQIGYSENKWTALYDELKKNEYKEDFLLKSKLIFQSQTNHNLLDFFRNRIIFPIQDINGNICGFGGRIMPEAQDKEIKFLNSTDSDFYNKSNILYGFNFAKKAIVKADNCNIVEGYNDVIKLHQINQENTVASCGTALTDEQILLIKKFTKNVTLIYDGDIAGEKSILKNGISLIKQELNVSVIALPKKEDPDSFFIDSTHFEKYHHENKINFTFYEAKILLSHSKNDPIKKAEAITKIATTIAFISDENKRLFLIENISEEFKKEFGITKKALDLAVKKRIKDPNIEKAIELDTEDLPKYLTDQDKRDYIKYSFYESKEGIEKNQYFYKHKGRISNFIMKPLFHIRSINDTRKLFELINKYDTREIIEIDMHAMNSLNAFRREVESRGNFLWEGSEIEFLKLKRKLYDKTKYCWKIDRLGWQKENFYAFANGICHEGEFIPIDENGIVKHKSEHFYIAAFSSIYISDKSIFKDERKFMYKPSDRINLNEWANKFIKVYNKQSMISICFWLTSLFSDHIFYKLNNLPILNFFGPKGCGKNEHAISLLSLFGEPQNELQIHNATKPGISAYLEQFVNALCWIDEYKNNMNIENIEMIKAIYNRNGRTRGSIKEGVSKETTPIDSMVILSGQEMPTADIALFSRCLFLAYSSTNHSHQEKKFFNDLKNIEKGGLSHLTFEILKFRTIIEKNYIDTFRKVEIDLIKIFEDSNNMIDDRLMRNFITVIATFKCLENYIQLPFKYDELLEVSKKTMIHQNELLNNSNELSQFWGQIESLVEKEMIKEGNNYKIEMEDEVKLKVNKDEFMKYFKPAKHILYLKWAGIYQSYAENSKKSSQNILPENTLLYYLKNSDSFIGIKKSFRFNKDINQAYCFDYRMLDINLTRNLNADNYEVNPITF